MRKKELQAFEERIKNLFEEGKIRAPVHLSGDNEEALMEIFREYQPGDWIFSTWRNHYHWLLSGRDPRELERQILAGDSMSVYDDRFFTSSIVGGTAPIALGVALALKLKQAGAAAEDSPEEPETERAGRSHARVWCFLGDMAAAGGLARECIRYAEGHDLPIRYIIEDNGLSVTTETEKVWGTGRESKTRRYQYKRRYPHAGTGRYVDFDATSE
ncbi:MAG: thiamine pyrophosphate-dependent enzyme [Desulfosudaceae bacterium]